MATAGTGARNMCQSRDGNVPMAVTAVADTLALRHGVAAGDCAPVAVLCSSVMDERHTCAVLA